MNWPAVPCQRETAFILDGKGLPSARACLDLENLPACNKTRTHNEKTKNIYLYVQTTLNTGLLNALHSWSLNCESFSSQASLVRLYEIPTFLLSILDYTLITSLLGLRARAANSFTRVPAIRTCEKLEHLTSSSDYGQQGLHSYAIGKSWETSCRHESHAY